MDERLGARAQSAQDAPKPETLAQILQSYPLRIESFARPDGGTISAQVCRNPDGLIVYVKPGSRVLTPGPTKDKGTS